MPRLIDAGILVRARIRQPGRAGLDVLTSTRSYRGHKLVIDVVIDGYDAEVGTLPIETTFRWLIGTLELLALGVAPWLNAAQI